MKKQTKEIIETLILFLMSLFLLAFGCIAKEQGREGIGIFMIMCSLYVALWVHAGLTGTIIARKIRERDNEVNWEANKENRAILHSEEK